MKSIKFATLHRIFFGVDSGLDLLVVGEERGDWGYTFLKKKNPGIFNFAPRNSRENKLSPLDIQQNFVTPLGNSNFKNQDPRKFYMSFSWIPLEISLLF